MNNVKLTVTIPEINQFGADKIYGICRFKFKRNTTIIESNLAFRAKGIPASIIQNTGENVTGTATGYLGFTTKFTNRGYNEIKAILIIREFVVDGTTAIDSKDSDDVESLPQTVKEANNGHVRPAVSFAF